MRSNRTVLRRVAAGVAVAVVGLLGAACAPAPGTGTTTTTVPSGGRVDLVLSFQAGSNIRDGLATVEVSASGLQPTTLYSVTLLPGGQVLELGAASSDGTAGTTATVPPLLALGAYQVVFAGTSASARPISSSVYFSVDIEGDVVAVSFTAPVAEPTTTTTSSVPTTVPVDCTRRGARVDLHGCDLSGADLSGKYLYEADLSGANLSGANLSNTVLTGANLAGADLSDAQLVNTHLASADLSGVTAQRATLTNTVLSAANLTAADFTDSSMQGADLKYSVLSGTSLTRVKGDANASFSYLDLPNVTGTTLTGFSFIDAIQTGIVGTPANANCGVQRGFLLGCGTRVTGADLAGVSFGSGFIDGTFVGSDLSGAHFDRDLCGQQNGYYCVFLNARFINSTLVGADFSSAQFGGRAEDSDLSGASFVGASVFGRFLRSNLTGARFDRATVAGLDLEDVNVQSVDFALSLRGSGGLVRAVGITGVPTSLWSGTSLLGNNLVGTYTDLSKANLSGVDLSGRDLSGSRFDEADLRNAALSGTNLTNSTFNSSNLDGADFSGAIFSNTSLAGARVSGTNFSSTNPALVSSGRLIGNPTGLPVGWVVAGGYLAGPGANLAGANLASVNLSGLDLRGANLENAKLTGANVSGTLLGTSANLSYGLKSGGLVGVPAALTSGWVLRAGYLIFPGADLYGADFTGVDLRGLAINGSSNASFSGADLRNAQLSGTFNQTSFAQADMRGAQIGTNYSSVYVVNSDFRGANLTDAVFYNGSVSNTDFTGATVTGVYAPGFYWGGGENVCPDGARKTTACF